MAEAWPINKWEHTNTSSESSSLTTLRLGARTGSPSKPSSSTPSPCSNPSTSAASSQTQTATTPSVPPVTATWPWPQQATAEPPACGPRIDARILPLPSCNLTLPSLWPTVSTRRSANAVTVFPSPSPRAQTSSRPEPWGLALKGAPRPSGTSDHLHTLTPRSAWKAQTTDSYVFGTSTTKSHAQRRRDLLRRFLLRREQLLREPRDVLHESVLLSSLLAERRVGAEELLRVLDVIEHVRAARHGGALAMQRHVQK